MIEINNYEVHFSRNELNNFSNKIKKVSNAKNLFIVTDKLIHEHYSKIMLEVLKDFNVTFVFAEGKSFESYEKAITDLLDKRFKKTDLLVSLGGGTIGDLTGFIASTIFRGVDYIQIPTTLLSQIDSSIGSKTAIDTSFGKNLVGSFYDPKLVLIDTVFLDTLSKEEYNNGFAEAIKMAALFDRNFFNKIKNEEFLTLEDIKTIVNMKKDIVLQDPFDKGIRRALNFGHTYGHAIEKTDNYKRFKHGEAISHGMIIALVFGVGLGKTKVEAFYEIKEALTSKGLLDKPINHFSTYIKDIAFDKKNEEHGLNFILLNEIGKFEFQIMKNDIYEKFEY